MSSNNRNRFNKSRQRKNILRKERRKIISKKHFRFKKIKFFYEMLFSKRFERLKLKIINYYVNIIRK